MKVMIIDYGRGNLKSVRRAFEECYADVEISDDPNDLKNASHIVLPGVGAFKDCMNNLTEVGWKEKIRQAVLELGIPMLGICLGMQLLASKGFESGETDGLDLIPGKVKRLLPVDTFERIPHVGWDEIYSKKGSRLFAKIPDGTDFYFVHSYHFIPDNEESILTETPYCGGFVSSVINNNVFGVQFHPEKSHNPGFQLIKNFLQY